MSLLGLLHSNEHTVPSRSHKHTHAHTHTYILGYMCGTARCPIHRPKPTSTRTRVINECAHINLSLLGYYFNKTGLLACEPFYSKSSYRILSSCALYFPTTMVLMYCYGSSFHANRYRLATPSAASLSLNVSNGCGNGGAAGAGTVRLQDTADGRREADLAATTLTANGSGLEQALSWDVEVEAIWNSVEQPTCIGNIGSDRLALERGWTTRRVL